MKVFGSLTDDLTKEMRDILASLESMQVERTAPSRSDVPHPKSTDLELALLPVFKARSFRHHEKMTHPAGRHGFEYDFWRAADGVAIEIMGYRADDEIYKDILKFHVHSGTRVGVVFVPRYKWISSRKTEVNYIATLKALSFAESYLDLDALVAVPYDWERGTGPSQWRLLLDGLEQ